MTSFCTIKVEDNNTVSCIHKEHGALNITKVLHFGDDISIALDNHAPTAVWWSTITSDERMRLKTFQEGALLRYMAHCRYYAKLALKGMGDKETLEAVKDYVSILFSKDRSPLADSLVYAAWYGSLLSTHQTATAVKKHLDLKTAEQKDAARKIFEGTMYAWETDQQITLDDMVEEELEIERNVEVLSSVVENFKQRGVLLSSLAADRRAEMQSIGTGRINELNQNLVNKAKR